MTVSKIIAKSIEIIISIWHFDDINLCDFASENLCNLTMKTEIWCVLKHTDFQLYWFSTQKGAFLSSNSSSKCTVNCMGNFVFISSGKMILKKKIDFQWKHLYWFSIQNRKFKIYCKFNRKFCIDFQLKNVADKNLLIFNRKNCIGFQYKMAISKV